MYEMTFKALFEHSSIGIILSNDEGVIERANPYASKIFGYETTELIGQYIEVLIPQPLRERHVKYRQQYIENPHPRAMGKNINLLALKKSGDTFPVEISLTFFETNGHRQIVSFINDITERKRAEDELLRMTEELESKVTERTKELSDALLELSVTNKGLQQEMEHRKRIEAQMREMLEKQKELNELKSRFVSMASHEFRTPLGGILTSASLIAKYPKTEDEPKREKHVQTIKKSVRNLNNILNDFLSLDKLEQGKISSSPTRFYLTQFIDESIEELKEMSGKGHDLQVTHAIQNLEVFQDKEMIRNIIFNLVSNAIKYSMDGTTIHIRTNLKDQQVSLEIQDYGVGIPVADQKHLFERFFRAQNVLNLQGTGLGLNIVKRYVDLMGGSIHFTSRENEGTTFQVILPKEK
ncbi:MAG: PAS domain S-box protein [Bacteriovoracaceae bacterium]|nr:PAS domain S-box protein [Bacteriovoracaceae bacterium]